MGRFDNLGRVLRLRRREQGRRQAEVAAAAGISVSMLSKYETGAQSPALVTFDRLLTALGLSLGDLERRLELERAQSDELTGVVFAPPLLRSPASPAIARPPTGGAHVPGSLPDLLGLPAERSPELDAALAELLSALRGLTHELRDAEWRHDRRRR